jgi:hypothetical protein
MSGGLALSGLWRLRSSAIAAASTDVDDFVVVEAEATRGGVAIVEVEA